MNQIVKGRFACSGKLLLGLFVVVFATTMLPAPAVHVFAQQPGQNKSQKSHAPGANQNETKLNTGAATKTTADAVRPFRVNFPKAALDDLRQRIAATRWRRQRVSRLMKNTRGINSWTSTRTAWATPSR